MSEKKRGLASMTLEQKKEIGRKGGLAVSKNSEYMAEIGRKGGLKSGETRRKQKEKRDGLSQ